jgi:hypothetical protein
MTHVGAIDAWLGPVTSGHGKLLGYFNLDNGSGKTRDGYLQGREAMRPAFES